MNTILRFVDAVGPPRSHGIMVGVTLAMKYPEYAQALLREYNESMVSKEDLQEVADLIVEKFPVEVSHV